MNDRSATIADAVLASTVRGDDGFQLAGIFANDFASTIFRRGNLANQKTRDWGNPISCRAEEPLWCAVAGVDR
jgi:hypothetical protein